MKKDQFLKIAKVKDLDEFYRKFPTEEAFMKVHGKAFKKAQIGAYIGGEQDAEFQPINFNNAYDSADMMITGSTRKMRDEAAYKQAQLDASKSKGGGMGDALSQVLGNEQIMSAIAGAKKGVKIKKALDGDQLTGSLQEFEAMSGYSDPKSKKKGSGFMKAVEQASPYVGDLVQGIQMIKQQKNALKSAEQMLALSDLTRQASSLRPEQIERRYLRPEDSITTGQELFPIYGTGSNPLSAKNGAEIANTFAPNTLYDDLGYEPLYDSERVKQFFNGGKMQTAKYGDWLAGTDIYRIAESGGGNFGSQAITSVAGESAGGKIGGTVGKAAGTAIGGPVGGMIGEIGGNLIGSLIDRTPGKIKRAKAATDKNIMAMALNQGGRDIQQQYTSFMENGGNVNPQIINEFGDYSLEDLLAADPTMDTLRAGGHLKEYTEPSARALQTYEEGGFVPEMEEGGELQTYWGGYAEPISRNPYLPDGGETIMFRGQSHDESDGQGNTGIGITYGENPVEVERGEPAVKLRDGGDSESLVVFGNLKVPNQFVPILGEEAKGKKFKNYVADLSKKENKQNKIIDKSSTELDNLEMNTPFDKLAMGSYRANILGANMKLKEIADKKIDASALQSAMNDTFDILGLEANNDGVVKADRGIRLTALDKQPRQSKSGKYFGGVTENDIALLKINNPWYDFNKFDPLNKNSVKKFQKAWNKKAKEEGSEARLDVDGDVGRQTVSARTSVREMGEPVSALERRQKFDPSKMNIKLPAKSTSIKPATNVQTEDKKKGSPLMDILNQALPYLRPTDAERLDPNQLAGEMYALSQNQLEPVQAQLFQPELNVPYDISLQDILNENQADFRSQQRMVGYNPAVQGILNAQKYAANQKVLGEQFRLNQAQKQQVYDQNRALLNQAKLQNLGILDQQYQRQAAAKSATKATTQAALNSIASKYAQNKLENRTLQTYENLYNYRFDPAMRAINMNPLVNFQAMMDNASSEQLNTMMKSLQDKTEKTSKKKSESRNGSIVKALKSL